MPGSTQIPTQNRRPLRKATEIVNGKKYNKISASCSNACAHVLFFKAVWAGHCVLIDTDSVKQNLHSLVESHWNLHTYCWASRECVALEDPLRIPTGLPCSPQKTNSPLSKPGCCPLRVSLAMHLSESEVQSLSK